MTNTFCILCREPIPEDRQRRGAVTCCPDHAREYRRQRRAERSLRFCRLCGRPAKRKKLSEPVLHEHSEILEAVRPAAAMNENEQPKVPLSRTDSER
jgi:hypothetical protein